MKVEVKIFADVLEQITLYQVDSVHPHKRSGLRVFDTLSNNMQVVFMRLFNEQWEFFCRSGWLCASPKC